MTGIFWFLVSLDIGGVRAAGGLNADINTRYLVSQV
jgi:hypothetical protein